MNRDLVGWNVNENSRTFCFIKISFRTFFVLNSSWDKCNAHGNKVNSLNERYYKIADLIKFYLQHISSDTVANVDHKTLSIPFAMPTYSDHGCIFNHFSPSLWLWKMNWELECLIFFTQWPLCWMLAPEEFEVMEIVPGTPDSNHSPDQPPARWQLSARRTSIIHQYIHNEKFHPSFVIKTL